MLKVAMRCKNFDWVQVLSVLWAPFGVFLLTLSVILWGPVIVMAGLLGLRGGVMNALVWSWTTFIPKYFFIRCRVSYPPQFERDYRADKSLIVISNHQSLLDIPAAYMTFQGNLRMLAKDSLFRVPIFGQAMWASGQIKIVRGNRTSGKAALESIRQQLSGGKQVWIAPEGTRSTDWHMLPFKAGAFAMSLDLDLPIQPIVVLNAFQILGKKQSLPRVGSTLEVEVLPLIDPKKLGLADRVELSRYVWQQMNGVLERYWRERT